MLGAKLYLFGPPRLEVDDQPVNISLRKAIALLAYLAVTDQPHSRDHLATLFWPDANQKRARTNLRQMIYDIRQRIPLELLSVTSETLGLNQAVDLTVDVHVFKRHAETGLAGMAQIRPLSIAAEVAIDDFMASFTLNKCPDFDDWQFFRREELRQSLAQVLIRLTEIQEGNRAFDEALPTARRWLALDPLHEPAHRKLMRLYALADQQAAAMRQYEECVRILETELGVPPEQATTSLFEAIRTRTSLESETAASQIPKQPTPETPQTNIPGQQFLAHLPPETTPFIGRVQEVAEILTRLLDPTCRLLTLVGPGGIGKTRLALHVAQQVIARQNPDNFADGVLFVSLQSLATVDEIVATVAEVIDLQLHVHLPPIDQLLDHLQAKQVLLVLDNVEHMIDEARILVKQLISQPNLTLLATSREALKLQEEWFHPISGLRLPPRREAPLAVQQTKFSQDASADPRSEEAYDSVNLFVQTAQRMLVSFEATKHETDIAHICQLVDGMPLAIELAAAWLKVLTCEEIAIEIEKSLDILTAQNQDIPTRHRSVRAVFEQTWQQLTPDEQILLSKLAVFQNGWTREAAEDVAEGTLFALATLVDKALIHPMNQWPATAEKSQRYHFHPLLQQYIAEKSAAYARIVEQTRVRHTAYYLQQAAAQAKIMRGSERYIATHFRDTELANIRAAWQGAVMQQNWQKLAQCAILIVALFEGRALAGEQLFSQAASQLNAKDKDQAFVLSIVLLGQAQLQLWLGMDADAIEALLDRALPVLQQHAASYEIMRTLDLLGNVAWLKGEHRRARQVLDEGLTLARVHGTPDDVGELLIRKGLVERELGAVSDVMTYYQQSLAELRTIGNPSTLAHQLLTYGEYLVVHGEITRGQKYLEECQMLALEIGGGQSFYPFLLIHLAIAAYKLGHWADAEAYLDTVLIIAKDESRTHPEALAHLFIGRCKVAQNELIAAESRLKMGLSLGQKHNMTLVMTLAVVCFAQLRIAQNELPEAVRLLTFAINHEATENRDKLEARDLLSEIEQQLPATEFRMASQNGSNLSLPEAASQLLQS